MKRLIPVGFQEIDQIVLSCSFNDEIEIQGRAGQAIRDESHTADHGIPVPLPGQEI
jgi:hypothetical protein